MVAAKLALHEATLEARISNVALAQQLGMGEKAVRLLRDLLHQSRIDQLDAVLRTLGKCIGSVIEAA